MEKMEIVDMNIVDMMVWNDGERYVLLMRDDGDDDHYFVTISDEMAVKLMKVLPHGD